jgi:hypothetical protein
MAFVSEVPVCWGGCWDSLLAIASPEDSVADYVAACRATGQKPFLDGPHFKLSRACGMIDWIKTAQGMAAIFATMVAWWNLGLPRSCSRPRRRFTRIEAPEQFNRDTRLLVPDQTLVECQPARDALAPDGCGVAERWR